MQGRPPQRRRFLSCRSSRSAPKNSNEEENEEAPRDQSSPDLVRFFYNTFLSLSPTRTPPLIPCTPILQDMGQANPSNELTNGNPSSSTSPPPPQQQQQQQQQQYPINSLPPSIAAADPVAASFMDNHRYEKAIQAYTDSLTAYNDDDDDDANDNNGCTSIIETVEKKKLLLLGRSQAYCGLSRYLRNIPAAQSEANAVYAPDPEQLAACALRDAEKALSMDSIYITLVHIARSDALFLLERYKEAYDAVKIAVSHSPRCPITACRLRRCELAMETCNLEGSNSGGLTEACKAGRERLRSAISTEIECTLCMRMLYEPVTTSCGHTFCKSCFARSADHSNRCPMCRTVLHVGRELPITVILKDLLEKTFPEEYDARRKEEEALVTASLNAQDSQGRTRLPLFVMSALLPGEHMALNIFEPRYRLMIRRCMEGNRRFGMASVTNNHTLHPIACEAEIVECEALPDGRFYIEIVGRRRFRVVEPGEQDGYRTAMAEYVCDDAVAMDTNGGGNDNDNGGDSSSMDVATDGNNTNEPLLDANTTTTNNNNNNSNEVEELERVSEEVESMVDIWVERMRALGRSRRAAAELLRRVGDKPCREDKEKLSFWMANLVCPLIECSALKVEMLCTTSTLKRMKLLRTLLQQMQSNQATGCVVM